MGIHKVQALTLKCTDYSETSQVVAILTRPMGRVRLLAKGSRRARQNFGGPLEPWTRAEAMFSLRDPNRLGTLTEFYEVEGFRDLRKDLNAYYAACYVTELLLAIVPDLDPQSEVFDLTVAVFRMLNGARTAKPGRDASTGLTKVIVFYFEVRLLQLLGYWPGFRFVCVDCGRELLEQAAYEVSPSRCGMICQACRIAEGDVIVVKVKVIEALNFLAQAGLEQLQRVKLNPETAGQMRDLINRVVSEIANRELSCVRNV